MTNQEIKNSKIYKKWISAYDKHKIWIGPCEQRVAIVNTKQQIPPPRSKKKLKEQYRLVSLLELKQLYNN